VAFSSPPAGLRTFTRAKVETAPMPMPVGPALKDSAPAQGEPIAPPTDAPTPSDSVWGGVVSRWVDDGGILLGDGGVGLVGEGGECDGGDGGCPVGDCCPPCCPCDGPLGLRGRLFGCKSDWACCQDGCNLGCFWVSAEYLLWSVRDGNTPPLVTASPVGTPREAAAVLGQPGTFIAYGGDDAVDYNAMSGARFTVGFGIPSCPRLGFESSYFFLGRRSVNFLAGSGGNPNLGRPVNDVSTGLEIAQLVAFPDVVVGNISVASSTKLWGVDGNARYRLCCGCNYFVDLLGGFRYLQLEENLNITESLSVLSLLENRLAPAGTRIMVFDSFNTRNQFYGGQLGIEGEYRWQRWTLGGQFKLGMGVMHQAVDISGATIYMVPGASAIVERGGVLAAPTNIGSYRSDRFAVVPEVGVKLGYQLTDHVRLFVGYNFLYASSVVRPGDQIDRTINLSQVPTVFGQSPLVGAPRPRPMFQQTDFWAQGVQFGVEVKY
jgi:hypothetical protein